MVQRGSGPNVEGLHIEGGYGWLGPQRSNGAKNTNSSLLRSGKKSYGEMSHLSHVWGVPNETYRLQ